VAEHHGGDLGVEQRVRDGFGAVPADSTSCRAAWNTLSTRSSAINSKNGLSSIPGASASITIASSGLAICATQSRG
jgi:hypothetical protein